MPYRTARTDFIKQVLQTKTDDCILWPFAKRKGTGYGHFSIWFDSKQHNFYAHNFICGLAHGSAPNGLEAAHSCGNSMCVNPKHLRWATHKENMQDAVRHGRMRGRPPRVRHYDL